MTQNFHRATEVDGLFPQPNRNARFPTRMNRPVLLFLFMSFFAVPAMAQRPPAEVRLTAGWTGFLDDAPDHHVAVGGAFRYYLSPRFSVEPELMYLGGDGDHYDITLAPHIAFDFVRSGKVVPYVIGGVGWMHSSFGRFTTDDIWVDGGVGVKLFLTDHMYFAPELRAGWEPHFKVTGTVGFTF
jgi:hypothetical protein